MGSIYMLSNQGKLSKESGHFLYKDYEGNLTRICPDDAERFVLAGAVSITGECFNLLAEERIPVMFLPYGSSQTFVIDYGETKNVFLHKEQFLLQSDRKRSLAVAKSIVQGKILNQMCYMQRINRRNEGLIPMSDFDLLVKQMKKLYKQAEKAREVEELRGYEGMASRIYFSVFGTNLKSDWAVFEKRSRRPPLSNVNSLLSFLYSLLEERILEVLIEEGLDPMVGNLHELCYGKNVLVFDLMEEFRTPVCDSLCCSLINLNVLAASDFDYNEDGSVYMNKSGRSKAIDAFEERMKAVISQATGEKGRNVTEVIRNQVIKYKDFVLGKSSSYEPFCSK